MRLSLAISALAVSLAGATDAACAASSDPEQLAIDSYSHLMSRESMLVAAIRKADRADFMRFIWNPTSELIDRWPALQFTEYTKYRRCQSALISFRTWSEDQFNARGELPKTASSAKDYFEQKAQCRKALPVKV